MTFPTITTSALCPACRGEGSTTFTGGGTFDARAEQWYPREITTPCDNCDGSGEIIVCRSCGEEDRDCICDEMTEDREVLCAS